MKTNNLFAMGFDACLLAMDASAVIAHRLVKFSALDSAALAEAQRMVAEKVEATVRLQTQLAGQMGFGFVRAIGTSLQETRKTVRGNRRRLERSARAGGGRRRR